MVTENLNVSYLGKKVDSLVLTSILIKNNGNLSTEPKDFEKEIVIIAPSGTSIYSAKTKNSRPDNLKPYLWINENSILIKSLLINPKDSFQVDFISSNIQSPLIVEARIAGISKITETISDERRVIDEEVKNILSIISVILSALAYSFIAIFIYFGGPFYSNESVLNLSKIERHILFFVNAASCAITILIFTSMFTSNRLLGVVCFIVPIAMASIYRTYREKYKP